ncbi:YcxB family protein [Hathewaya histolytica]|uniref:YcxB family protein n=1 Tax=Hathewaya histolytica TaxID=1498 RepID=UPI003B67AA94
MRESIEISTRVREEDLKRVFKLTSAKRYGKYLFLLILVFNIMALHYDLDFQNIFKKLYVNISIFLLIGLVYLFYILPKKSYKNISEYKIKYKFTEDYMFIESSTESKKHTSKIEYRSLYKVHGLNDIIVIFENQVAVYIIPKRDCANQEFEDLKSILRTNVKKYIESTKFKI